MWFCFVFPYFSAPDVLVTGPEILVSDHYLFRERCQQESSESEGMLFARYMQVHEIKSAYGRCCFWWVFYDSNTEVSFRRMC